MTQPPNPFRDFGILPEGLPPPPERVRAYFSTGRIVGGYVVIGLVTALGLGLTVLVLLLPSPLCWLGSAAMLVGFGGFLLLLTRHAYLWVELHGRTLHAQNCLTGRIVQRSLEDVERLQTIIYPREFLATNLTAAFLGRIRGVEVQFRDRRTPMSILRTDPVMTNAQELIEAVIYTMGQIRAVEAEVIDYHGMPLVRSIHWQGDEPTSRSGSRKVLKIWLGLILSLALLFGAIFGFMSRQAQQIQLLTSVPPQERTLQTLLDNGPGSTPYVTLTDFTFGGYEVYTERGSWSNVYIALFPAGHAERPPGALAIRAVLKSETIRNEAELQQYMQQARITGICSDAPGLTRGTIREGLMHANPGSHLTSAWVIAELRQPPSATDVERLILGSVACFILVFACAVVIFKIA